MSKCQFCESPAAGYRMVLHHMSIYETGKRVAKLCKSCFERHVNHYDQCEDDLCNCEPVQVRGKTVYVHDDILTESEEKKIDKIRDYRKIEAQSGKQGYIT